MYQYFNLGNYGMFAEFIIVIKALFLFFKNKSNMSCYQ